MASKVLEDLFERLFVITSAVLGVLLLVTVIQIYRYYVPKDIGFLRRALDLRLGPLFPSSHTNDQGRLWAQRFWKVLLVWLTLNVSWWMLRLGANYI